MKQREFRADILLANNIRTLLSVRGIDSSALAAWCGHRPPWISKILSGDRGVQVKDLGRIADFFGLTVSQLFQHGIHPLTERRKGERRDGSERRSGKDRRRGGNIGRLHPDTFNDYPFRHRLSLADDSGDGDEEQAG